MEELREMSVYVDGKKIAKELHIKLKGRATMCLRPDYWILDIYSLSGYEDFLIRNAKEIWVCGHGGSELCRGNVEDLYVYYEGIKHITRVTICDGGNFWESSVSLSMASGTRMGQAIRTMIARCSYPVKIASYQADEAIFFRGQVFHGRTVSYLADMAKSVSARVFLTRGAIAVFGKGKTASVVKLKSDGGLVETSNTNKAVIARLSVIQGFAIGQLVELPDDSKRYRLICQSIDVDNKEGAWKTELLMVDEEQMSDDDWGGGM